MKIAAVVCEFNPFHNGHAFLAAKLRQEGAQCVAGIMSGNFVQRGEPALFDQGFRAETALKNGYDLILQLPLAFSAAGASDFARGAVRIAAAAGCFDTLAFASECGDTGALETAARIIDSDEAQRLIKEELESGITYAAARENAVRKISPESADLLKEPNNILGIEYIRELKKQGPGIVHFTVRRAGAGHGEGEKSGSFASSGEIRRMLRAGESAAGFVPDIRALEAAEPFDYGKYETAVLYKLRSMTAGEIAQLPDISEGIENRIAAAAYDAVTLDDFYSLAKTKRYTLARIRRIALAALLGITAKDTAADAPYIRIMGFTPQGAAVIRQMNESATLPVITKAADVKNLDENAKRAFALQCAASDIYFLLRKNPLPCGEEKRFQVKKIDR